MDAVNIYKLSEMSAEQKRFVLKRAETDISEHMKIATEVAYDIRDNGDDAVLKYTEKFDRVKLIIRDLFIITLTSTSGTPYSLYHFNFSPNNY